MKITFIEPSDQELDDGIEYYEDINPGLGAAFYEEVMYFISLIEMYPFSWTKVGKRTRRCLLKRFPHFILYIPENEELNITAIGHQHRDPEYFADRIY